MKRVNIGLRAEITLSLTRREIGTLMTLARAHYDDACRAAAEPGPRGTLNGFYVCLGEGDDPGDTAEHTLTWREVDTLCKICELGGMAKTLHLDPQTVAELSVFFGQTLTRMREALQKAEPVVAAIEL